MPALTPHTPAAKAASPISLWASDSPSHLNAQYTSPPAITTRKPPATTRFNTTHLVYGFERLLQSRRVTDPPAGSAPDHESAPRHRPCRSHDRNGRPEARSSFELEDRPRCRVSESSGRCS